jgi:hypothetical protein
MNKSIVVRWQDWSGSGLEHTLVSFGDDSNSAEGVVVSAAGDETFAVRYRVRCDRSWAATQLEVEMIGESRGIALSGDGRGNWKDSSGASLRKLDGAIDLDLSITPFTNTLPIRRLHLARGESSDIVAAYVHFPDLAISADPQRYTCLEPMRRYRYESRDSDFMREIEVDSDGLVLTYPGLFRRSL